MILQQNSTDVRVNYFYDEDNVIQPIDVLYERHIVNPNGLIQLKNIPSPLHTVFTIIRRNGTSVIQYNKVESVVNQYDFMVDYINGILTFHSSQVGKEIQISYTNSIGKLNISADIIFTNIDNQGNIVQTLGTVIDEGRSILSDLSILGGASKVITELQGYIESARELTGNIIQGSNINTELKKSTDTAKSTNTTLSSTITNANNKISDLNSWVESHGDIVDLDNRVGTAEDKLNTVSASLEQKAEQVDLVVERERINQLTKLPTGSTTGDAELIDGRVGADGITYGNIGESIRNQIRNEKQTIEDLTIINDVFKFTKKKLYDNLTFTNGKNIPLANSTGMTITNYLEKATDSSVGNVSNPIKIRYENGKLIIKKWNWVNLEGTALFIYYFGKDGKYLSYMNMNNSNYNVIPEKAYYCLFIKYNNLPNIDSYFDSVDVEWLNEGMKREINELSSTVNSIVSVVNPTKVYTVGKSSSANYNSLTECFVALKNDTDNKTIYIEDGTYNIFEEIGGSAFATNITDAQTWQEVSVFVPENTKIIGIGNVVLNFLPEKAETNATASTKLSPINIRGNVYLENLKIYAKNCRYCIHDEVGVDPLYYNKTHELVNVECYYLKSDYNAGPGGQAYANGFQSGMKYIFKNCVFDGKARNPSFSMHNNNDSAPFSSTIIIDNCIFNPPSGQPDIAFLNSVTKQMYNTVKISNSYLSGGKVQLGKNWTGTSMKNAFDLTINNCNNITVENLLENNIFTPKIYNTIG